MDIVVAKPGRNHVYCTNNNIGWCRRREAGQDWSMVMPEEAVIVTGTTLPWRLLALPAPADSRQ